MRSWPARARSVKAGRSEPRSGASRAAARRAASACGVVMGLNFSRPRGGGVLSAKPMGSYIYPYARGVYPLFFLGRYIRLGSIHITALSRYIKKPSTHYLD